MNPLTAAFLWIEERLDKGAWARRAYLVAATVLTWQVVNWAQRYAEAALAKNAEGVATAAVIAAVSAVAGAVQGFAFKHYLESRSE